MNTTQYVFTPAGAVKMDYTPLILENSSNTFAKKLPILLSIFSACSLLLAFILSFFHSLNSLSLLFLCIVFFILGIPSILKSLQDVKKKRLSIHTLMTLGAFLSFILNNGMEGGLLLVLFNISETLELYVIQRAQQTNLSLEKLNPKQANVIIGNNQTKEKALDDILIGDLIFIKSGQIVPLDGRITKGTASFNLSYITGESTLIDKEQGDFIIAGAHLMEGSITLKVEKNHANSTLSKLLNQIIQAQQQKPAFQRWLESFSHIYATIIISFSLLYASLAPFIFPSFAYLGEEGSIYRSIAFLIAASPCALIIAMPIAYLSSISACAKKGILIKGGVYLDRLNQCNTFAFDKTGTLTTGKLLLDRILCLHGSKLLTRNYILSVAAALEKHVVHPISTCIIQTCKDENIDPIELHSVQVQHGKGVTGFIESSSQENLPVTIGNLKYIKEATQIDLSTIYPKEILALKQKGQSLCCLIIGSYHFILSFSDTLRDHMKTLMHTLQHTFKFKTLILSGDHHQCVSKIAQTLSIHNYYAELSPQDKFQHTYQLSKQGGLAMVGDGVNDGPAMAYASVGMSLGKIGSHIAVDLADVVFLQDDLHLLPWLIKKAKKNKTIVLQNTFLALVLLIPTSLLSLLGIVPIWLAVLLHEGGTIIVGINGLRLLKNKN